MISVGIDVSKEKSTVCILKPYGEIVSKPFEISHSSEDFKLLDNLLKRLDGEIKIVMEATGIYHLPVVLYFVELGYFVSVINPYGMKKYAKNTSIRLAKTDKLDSITIANYGLEKWDKLEAFKQDDSVYEELKLLGRRYRAYMELHVKALLELTHMLDYTMPGIKREFKAWDERYNKDKLSDFVERFWHYDLITSMSLEEFITEYNSWAKEKEYQPSNSKAVKIYELATAGIPTLSSSIPSTKMLMLEAISSLRAINNSLNEILTRMKKLAKTLPEYPVVREMGGVGDVLAPKLIAEIGDIRKLHSSKALIACAGIDPPPFQSGQFIGTQRQISKRGSATLRKVGYEVMRMLTCHNEPKDNAVYLYIKKKENEGKNKKQAKIAGLNKFLRIYYARVSEVYNTE